MGTRTTQQIDQKLAETEAKRREVKERAETLEAKATAEMLETGTSESAEAAYKLRAQLPVFDRAMAALQNERVEAIARERAERNVERWVDFAKEAAAFVALAQDHDTTVRLCGLQRRVLL